jgi:hypothetical protein
MRRLLGILFAIGLVFAGVGFVRPQVIERSKAAWEPVVRSLQVMPFEEGESVELGTPGEYIVFLEGPVGDPGWASAAGIGVQLIERQSRQPLTSARQNLKYAFDHGGRHYQAIERVPVKNPGTYDLSLGGAARSGLDKNGFEVAVSPVKLVDSQAWKSKLWLAGGIAAGIVMGIVALSLLSTPRL